MGGCQSSAKSAAPSHLGANSQVRAVRRLPQASPPQLATAAHRRRSSFANSAAACGVLSLDAITVASFIPGPWALRLMGKPTALSRSYRFKLVLAMGTRSFASHSVPVSRVSRLVASGLDASAAEVDQSCHIWLTQEEKSSTLSITIYAEKERPADGVAMPEIVPIAQSVFDISRVSSGSHRCSCSLTLYDMYPGLQHEWDRSKASGESVVGSLPSTRPLLLAASNAAALNGLGGRLADASRTSITPSISRAAQAHRYEACDADGSGFRSSRKLPRSAERCDPISYAAAAKVAKAVGVLSFDVSFRDKTELAPLFSGVLEEFDSNNDGRLNKSELSAVLRSLGMSSPSDVRAAADCADPTQSGSYDRNQLLLWLSGIHWLRGKFTSALLDR
jgi:hypothetical protein